MYEYIYIISNVSMFIYRFKFQKIREMEVIDKKRTKELEKMIKKEEMTRRASASAIPQPIT